MGRLLLCFPIFYEQKATQEPKRLRAMNSFPSFPFVQPSRSKTESCFGPVTQFDDSVPAAVPDDPAQTAQSDFGRICRTRLQPHPMKILPENLSGVAGCKVGTSSLRFLTVAERAAPREWSLQKHTRPFSQPPVLLPLGVPAVFSLSIVSHDECHESGVAPSNPMREGGRTSLDLHRALGPRKRYWASPRSRTQIGNCPL